MLVCRRGIRRSLVHGDLQDLVVLNTLVAGVVVGILEERLTGAIVNDRDSYGNAIGHLLARCCLRQPLQVLL